MLGLKAASEQLCLYCAFENRCYKVLYRNKVFILSAKTNHGSCISLQTWVSSVYLGVSLLVNTH